MDAESFLALKNQLEECGADLFADGDVPGVLCEVGVEGLPWHPGPRACSSHHFASSTTEAATTARSKRMRKSPADWEAIVAGSDSGTRK